MSNEMRNPEEFDNLEQLFRYTMSVDIREFFKRSKMAKLDRDRLESPSKPCICIGRPAIVICEDDPDDWLDDLCRAHRKEHPREESQLKSAANSTGPNETTEISGMGWNCE